MRYRAGMNLKGGVSDWIESINSRCMNIWDVLPSPRLMYRMHPAGDGNGLVGGVGQCGLHVEVQPKPNPPFINCCEGVGLNHLNP